MYSYLIGSSCFYNNYDSSLVSSSPGEYYLSQWGLVGIRYWLTTLQNTSLRW